MIETWNFSLDKVEQTSSDKLQVVKDVRNDIVSKYTDLLSYDCYINYLKTLQTNSNKWVDYGYFDIGMVPFSMVPLVKGANSKTIEYNFITIHTEFAVRYLIKHGIQYYKLPQVSFMKGIKLGSNFTDIWVTRKDICEATGFTGNPLQFSIIEYLERNVAPEWNKTYNNR